MELGDDDARRTACMLLRSARFAALAAIDPESGHPAISRILIATDIDGVPATLISELSAHSRAIAADPRVSILVGEPGKGDPLAHPRLSVQCTARPLPAGSEHRQRLRTRFLRRHAKAALYADFADFAFVRLQPVRAALIGGFGKAYALTDEDLMIRSSAAAELAEREAELIEILNREAAGEIDILGGLVNGERQGTWHICGLDAAGIDLQHKDETKRVEYNRSVRQAVDLLWILRDMVKQAR